MIGASLIGLGIYLFVAEGSNSQITTILNGSGIRALLPNLILVNIGIIIIGVILFLIGFPGCFGAWRESQLFLGIVFLLIFSKLLIDVHT